MSIDILFINIVIRVIQTQHFSFCHSCYYRSYIADKATCIMSATAGCHTMIQQDLHILADRILQSINCTQKNEQNRCNSMVSLGLEEALVNPYATSDVICR